MSLWGIRPDFSGLSPCYRQIAYVLLTRAPVAARSIATSALPLDLHVLGLSLAFILSQDQTLRCISSSFFLYLQSDSRPKLTSFFSLVLHLLLFSLVNELCPSFSLRSSRCSFEKRCKGTLFLLFPPNFLATFLCYKTYFSLNFPIPTHLQPNFFFKVFAILPNRRLRNGLKEVKPEFYSRIVLRNLTPLRYAAVDCTWPCGRSD